MAFNEQYQVKISNTFPALDNLDDDVDIKMIWGRTREKIKASDAESLGYSSSRQR